MPLYEYECECGNRFEAIKPMKDRHNVTCECGKIARLKMSASPNIKADYFTVMKENGTVLKQMQDTEKTPPTGYRYDNPNLVEV